MTTKDYYAELGVARTATEDEIKKAYRVLAGRFHPDKNPGDAAAETRFKAINRAHQVLSDKKKRALYDEFGEEGLREGFKPEAARYYRGAGGRGHGAGPGGFQGGGVNLEDLFGGAAGGFGGFVGDLFNGGRRTRRGRGADIASEITIDLMTALAGTTVQVQLQGNSEPVTVRIPPGASDGDKVRVPGHGAPGPGGGPAGDLLIQVHVTPHEHFERDGLDLYLDLPITIGEAYRGAKVPVPTPGGEVSLTVPKGAQSGQVVRLKGRGVKRKDQQGDLYVRFLVKLPSARSAELEHAVDTLDTALTDDVRAAIRL
jgi:curved DNA-binding protein